MRIDEILNEGVNDKHIFKAIFMAGGPGSGKSYVEDKVIKGYGLKTLDGDAIVEYYKKYKPDSLSDDKIGDSITNQRDLYLNGRLGIVIQMTGIQDNVIGYRDIVEELGYETMMIFIDTDLKTSIKRNKNRDRVIHDQLAKNIWHRAQDRVNYLSNLFLNHFHLVDNNDDADLNKIDKIVRQFVNRPVNNQIALQWIKDQNENR